MLEYWISTESKFMVVIAGQQQTARITYGTQAKARAIVGSGRIGTFMIHDVGAGYTSSTVVHDTQNTTMLPQMLKLQMEC